MWLVLAEAAGECFRTLKSSLLLLVPPLCQVFPRESSSPFPFRFSHHNEICKASHQAQQQAVPDHRGEQGTRRCGGRGATGSARPPGARHWADPYCRPGHGTALHPVWCKLKCKEKQLFPVVAPQPLEAAHTWANHTCAQERDLPHFLLCGSVGQSGVPSRAVGHADNRSHGLKAFIIDL